MSLEVQCGKCDARFTLPDDLYERKVKGRLVTVRCKKCRADISVDGTESGTVVDPTPADEMPISLPPVAGLWVVSFGDDDDRELTVGQIKKALEAGEIDHETLVWNTSLDEWLMLGQAPTLKDLVSGDDVGGFLGTGVDVGADLDLAGGDEVGPFRSVSAGTMSDRPEGALRDAPGTSARGESASPPPVDGTPTVPLVMPSANVAKDEGARPPKPPKRLPGAPPKIRPAWLSEEEVKRGLPKTEDPDLPDGEEESPSSGTPDLRTLMTESLVPPKHDGPPKDDTASEEIFAIGGGGITAALPTIDLTSIAPAPASDPEASRSAQEEGDDDEAPVSSDRRRTKSKTSAGKPRKRDQDSGRARPAAPVAEEATRDSSMLWIPLAAAGALAFYWFVIRTPESGAPPERTSPSAPVQTAPPPTTTPTLTVAPPAMDAAAVDQRDSSVKPVSTNDERPTDPKETKPTDPKETKPTDPKETKPTASATGGEVAMAAPFDANAARSALASAAGSASSCRREGDPAGTATVVVTFAPSGRVTSANISGPPFAGTQTGGCIAAAMRQAKVPAFSGEHVTVSKTVVVQ